MTRGKLRKKLHNRMMKERRKKAKEHSINIPISTLKNLFIVGCIMAIGIERITKAAKEETKQNQSEEETL